MCYRKVLVLIYPLETLGNIWHTPKNQEYTSCSGYWHFKDPNENPTPHRKLLREVPSSVTSISTTQLFVSSRKHDRVLPPPPHPHGKVCLLETHGGDRKVHGTSAYPDDALGLRSTPCILSPGPTGQVAKLSHCHIVPFASSDSHDWQANREERPETLLIK